MRRVLVDSRGTADIAFENPEVQVVVPLTRLELAVGAVAVFLGGAGVARLAMPVRVPIRSLSIEGLHIASEPIAQGQTLVQESTWKSNADVFVTGWSYSVGAVGANPELQLLHRDTVLFFSQRGGAQGANPAFFSEGAGYRLLAGEPLTLRLKVTNRGAAGDTQGADALVYFLPVAAN
jgi:hypothetical protein